MHKYITESKPLDEALDDSHNATFSTSNLYLHSYSAAFGKSKQHPYQELKHIVHKYISESEPLDTALDDSLNATFSTSNQYLHSYCAAFDNSKMHPYQELKHVVHKYISES